MSRHAKNNTASAVFTHYERSKLKYGTQKQRLGKDSQKHFDACCLCLQPVVDPLCCTKGHIFCKECIFESLLTQKKEIKRHKKLYEAQQVHLKEKAEEAVQNVKAAELAAFDKLETGILPQKHQVFRPLNEDGSTVPTTPSVTPGNSTAIVVKNDNKSKSGATPSATPIQEIEPKLNAFWVPSLTPEAAAAPLQMPTKETFCIEGNHPLRLKQLVVVRFTLNTKRTDQEDPNHVRTARYCCPVCRRTLTDAPKAIVFKSCGHVHCLGCCEKFSSERICTVCDKPYKESDMIRLQSGGTGFAGHDDNIVAKKITPTPWL